MGGVHITDLKSVIETQCSDGVKIQRAFNALDKNQSGILEWRESMNFLWALCSIINEQGKLQTTTKIGGKTLRVMFREIVNAWMIYYDDTNGNLTKDQFIKILQDLSGAKSIVEQSKILSCVMTNEVFNGLLQSKVKNYLQFLASVQGEQWKGFLKKLQFVM